MKRIMIAVFVVLTGCADSVTERSTEDVERIVGQRLKDPTSAIFTNIRMHDSPVYPVACGEVNAKNSFGAYEGATYFIKYTGIGVRFARDDDPVALGDCCDVLLAYDPEKGSDVEDAPGFQQTCGRLDLFGTLR